MKPDKLTFIHRFEDDTEQLRIEYESQRVSENFVTIKGCDDLRIYIERSNIDWVIGRLREILKLDLEKSAEES